MRVRASQCVCVRDLVYVRVSLSVGAFKVR